MDKLLSRGVSPLDCRDKKGRTPLIVASEAGNASLIGALIRHGADINSVDADGETALMKAAYNRDLNVTELLVSHGADPNIRNNAGLTALEIAQEMDASEVAAFLLACLVTPKVSTKPEAAPESDEEAPSALIPQITELQSDTKESDSDTDPESGKSHSIETHEESEDSQNATVENSGAAETNKIVSRTQQEDHDASWDGLIDRFAGKNKSTVVWASPYDMFRNGEFNGLFQSNVDKIAKDIQGIVITTIFHADPLNRGPFARRLF